MRECFYIRRERRNGSYPSWLKLDRGDLSWVDQLTYEDEYEAKRLGCLATLEEAVATVFLMILRMMDHVGEYTYELEKA